MLNWFFYLVGILNEAILCPILFRFCVLRFIGTRDSELNVIYRTVFPHISLKFQLAVAISIFWKSGSALSCIVLWFALQIYWFLVIGLDPRTARLQQACFHQVIADAPQCGHRDRWTRNRALVYEYMIIITENLCMQSYMHDRSTRPRSMREADSNSEVLTALRSCYHQTCQKAASGGVRGSSVETLLPSLEKIAK